MADTSAKHFPINGGKVVTDLSTLSSLLKTRKTMAFVYAFMFAFVSVTVFLAFSPSSNSSSPWFSNIFSISTDAFTSPWFSGNSSTSPPAELSTFGLSSLPSQNTTRSNNGVRNPQIQTQVSSNSVDSSVLQANQAANASTVTKILSGAGNYSWSTENSKTDQAVNPNKTAISAPVIPPPMNQTSISSSAANQGGNSTGNWSPSTAAVQNSNSPAKIESFVENMVNCDLFDGEWVFDDSYPLYKSESCSLIDEQFNCVLNGRPDKDFQKYKWKPKGCSIARLDPENMLNMLRGKRLVFVGDSLNRNMWESLVCMLKGSVKDQSKVFEANGNHHFRGEASYSFIFKDYNCTVEFFVSPFLVQEWEMPDKNGTKKETLRLDLVGKSSDEYKDADIIVFNTGHWWTHDKTSKGKDYYQEGSHVYEELNVLEAFRKALTTWARWVDRNINPTKSLVFFRGYSASHFSGGQWNSGGACDNEVEPIKNTTYLSEYPPKMLVLEKVLRGMKTHVTYLNVTPMTDYRKDAHPSMEATHNIARGKESAITIPRLQPLVSSWRTRLME